MATIDELFAFVQARANEQPEPELRELVAGLDLGDEHDRDVLRFTSYRWRDHPDYPGQP